MARARLRGRAPSAERLREHDRHRPWVVLPVLAALLVYCWCYTHVAQWLGVPTPQDVVDGLGSRCPRSSTRTATSTPSSASRTPACSAATTSA